MDAYKIWMVSDKSEEKFLRKKAVDFSFKDHAKKEITELVARMKKAMILANGIGLSANQIGLEHKVFVALVPQAQGPAKFYAVFNPKLEKTGDEEVSFEEGCLSVPGVYGDVDRPERITVTGLDKNGKALKFKVWGLTARVFQHEIDHLNGKLFIDKARQVHTVAESPRLQEREKKLAEN